MALSTYHDLLDNVADWALRGDLTQYIPTFVTLFEAVANRRLRVRSMETYTLLTLSSGQATIPADYLSWRRATYAGSPRQELEFVHPSWLQAAYSDSLTGVGGFLANGFSSAFQEWSANNPARAGIFTIEGNTIKVRPVNEDQVEFAYFQKVPALSGTVNWLYAAHPDLYLFGTLTEAAAFTQEPDKCAMWKSRRDELFLELEQLDMQTPIGAMRVMGTVV